MPLREVRLSDRFDVQKREVLLSGVQALVRLPLAQKERDRKAGWDTAGYVTGYRGSPLGAVDTNILRAAHEYAAEGIVFNPGINEDLAATAIWGTQQAALRGEGRHQGVFALWYGKGPGVDRSGDVFRHANFAGTAPRGGVVCALGDDHTAESSTTCHQAELALVDAMMPILAPAGVQEVLDYGHAGWALSRYAGCWVGLKCLKDTVEATEVVDGDPHRRQFQIPGDFTLPEGGLSIRLGDTPQAQEARMHGYKRYAAAAFARRNDLDGRRIGVPGARFGIVAAGKSWLDAVHALRLLGIDDDRAISLGITAYKVGMVWPLEPAGIRQFASGLEHLVVVEEKRALLETEVKEVLYGRSAPVVVGKRNREGTTLFPSPLALDPVSIATGLAGQMEEQGIADDALRGRRRQLEEAQARVSEPITVRDPWFCAGCPHNSSTRVPDGSRAYAGIGCHYMVQWMDRSTEGFTHMGGEGANWVGEAPFSQRTHVFQNMGDGTFNHSGSMAVRAALASGVSMTFKVLFNDAVAMTGGQLNDGGLTAARVAQICRAEGVARIAVVSDDPHRLQKSDFPAGSTFDDRRDLDRVQRELREVPGVSLLVYEQTCAAEKRRRRRRGTLPDPDRRLFINDLVCEGCGDCGTASNCVAVLPKETSFGRKREIDQSSCNKDYSCLDGFCPSFVSVFGGNPRVAAGASARIEIPSLPQPALPSLERPWNLLVSGIGGTGVVTIGALLAMAAHLEGKAAGVMEMAGLAQKGGSVLVHCRIAGTPSEIGAIRLAAGEADGILAGDLVVAGSPASLATLDPGRSVVVCNTHAVPTGQFAADPDLHLPTQRLTRQIRAQAAEIACLDATRLAERTLGDSVFVNMIVLGAAWQAGIVPVSNEALLRAIKVNGVAVEANCRAFEIGRWAASDPDEAARILGAESAVEEDFPRALATREAFLEKSRDAACVRRYRDLVTRVADAENRSTRGKTELRDSVMRGYFKLLAYKDEYEVARLHLDTREQVRARFGAGSRLKFHLAPPLLARPDGSGRIRKWTFGEWIIPVFRVLAALRRIRGTWIDPFARTAERRMERELIREYEAMMDEVVACLAPENHAAAVSLAALPLTIRGFGHVKAKASREAASCREALLEEFRTRAVRAREAA